MTVLPSGPPQEAPAHFDHRDAGNVPQAWDRPLSELPEISLPAKGTRIVVLAAHPDDETLGCGGILANTSDRGFEVRVIIASDGEASHPDSPTHPPTQLAAVRRHESRDALKLLCPTAAVQHLGLPDGSLANHTLELSEAVDAAAGSGPAWILAPWEGDRHPDHAACARAARRSAQGNPHRTIMEYPIWLWHWADPHGRDFPSRTVRIPCGADGNHRRRAALASYRSQVLPLSDSPGDEAILGPAVVAHFDREFDVLIDPVASASDQTYFDRLFAESDDPWRIGTTWYEERKRAVLLAALPRRSFGAAFEPGCAAGHLTIELAKRCQRLLATDVASRAVTLTVRATAGIPHVSVCRMAVPGQWPTGTFDLIVLSEIGYYVRDVADLARLLRPSLTADGVVIACHWRHPTIEHLHSAEFVHDTLAGETGLPTLLHHEEADFLLDVFSVDGRSVARRDGLVY